MNSGVHLWTEKFVLGAGFPLALVPLLKITYTGVLNKIEVTASEWKKVSLTKT